MRKRIIASVLGGLAIATGVYYYRYSPKEKLVLSLEGNKLTWEDRSNQSVLNCKYEIYNDDFNVAKLTDKSYFVTPEKLIDENGPEKISNVNIVYGINDISFSWDDVSDLGTDNCLRVGLYNEKGRQLAYSNKVNINFASGIYRYIVELNGSKYEPIVNSYTVNRKNFNKGITRVKLYSVDKRNNRSETVEIPLYNFDVNLYESDGKLYYDIEDKTQGYKYIYYINGKMREDITTVDSLNEALKDNKSPNTCTGITSNVIDKTVFINWDDAEDRGQSFVVKVNGIGETYSNTAYSKEVTVQKESGIKGYYYSINKEADYKVTEKDNFSQITNVSDNLEYGKYYIHIAAVDNNDNISNTATKSFEVVEPIVEEPEQNKEDVVKPEEGNDKQDSNNESSNKDEQEKEEIYNDEEIEFMVYKMVDIVHGAGEWSRNKSIEIINTLTDKEIVKLSKAGLKVVVTAGQAEDYYKEITGKTIKDVKNIIVRDKKQFVIIIENTNVVSGLKSTLKKSLTKI